MLTAFKRKGRLFIHSKLFNWVDKSISTSLILQSRHFWRWGKDDGSIQDSLIESRAEENQIVPQYGDSAPRLSPLLILPVQRPIFPGSFAAAFVKDERTVEAVIANRDKGSGYLGLFLRTDLVTDTTITPELISSADHVYKVGTFAQIQNIIRTQNSIQLLLTTHRRITLEDIISFGPPIIGNVTHWDKIYADQSPSIKAYTNEIINASRYHINTFNSYFVCFVLSINLN